MIEKLDLSLLENVYLYFQCEKRFEIILSVLKLYSTEDKNAVQLLLRNT